MGFGFGFAVQRAVLQQPGLAEKSVELVLATATESFGQAAGAHPGGEIGGRAHEGLACVNTP